jgi:LytS/YehU family sensor histidine kinase
MPRRQVRKALNTKQIAFIAIMSSLGTILSGASLTFLPPFLVLPGVGIVAPDFSHVATFVAAVFGGAEVGALVGFLSGIYAGYHFGYVAGNLGLLSLLGVPLGKAMTGLLAGFLYRRLKISSSPRRATLALPLTLLAYVPEAIYTILYFVYIVPIAYGFSLASMIPFVMPKAWVEISIIGILMAILVPTLRTFINAFFHPGSTAEKMDNDRSLKKD